MSRTVSRAFDDALAAAGGSLPVWLVLISLKSGRLASQRELADAVGIQGATLSHHLNAMESAGLVTRRRDPRNRRLHLVELTPAGDALFSRLREVAFAFDQRLRRPNTTSTIRVTSTSAPGPRSHQSETAPGRRGNDDEFAPMPIGVVRAAAMAHRCRRPRSAGGRDGRDGRGGQMGL